MSTRWDLPHPAARQQSRCSSTDSSAENVHARLPIVYTPTVGTAIQQFNSSPVPADPRGVFLNKNLRMTPDGHRQGPGVSAGLGPDDVPNLVVASDAESHTSASADLGYSRRDIDISIWEARRLQPSPPAIDPRRVLGCRSLTSARTGKRACSTNPRLTSVLRRSRVRGARYYDELHRHLPLRSAEQAVPKGDSALGGHLLFRSRRAARITRQVRRHAPARSTTNIPGAPPRSGWPSALSGVLRGLPVAARSTSRSWSSVRGPRESASPT
jgi:hypothetical protein